MIDRKALEKNIDDKIKQSQVLNEEIYRMGCAVRSLDDELAEAFLDKNTTITRNTPIPGTHFMLFNHEYVYLVKGISNNWDKHNGLLKLVKKLTIPEYNELERINNL